jgi:hypothetical protein
MSQTAEKRIRLLGFDVPFGTPAEKLPLPVNDVWPKGCRIIWTSWNAERNCLVAAVHHPEFPQVPPFAMLTATPLPFSG